MSARCGHCHDEVRAEQRGHTGLHGHLPDGGGCLSCHGEHRGADGTITRIRADAFPHEATGFSLAAHRETRQGRAFSCPDCHDAGRWRFDEGRCAQCHREDAADFWATHVRDYGDACLACHDGVDRFGHDRFDHGRTAFALTGAHARTGCAECHAGGRFEGTPRECVACHEEPSDHRGVFGADCASCHGTDSWRGARFDHRFPLDHGGNGRVQCGVCHPEGLRTYTCTGCHEHSPDRLEREHREEGIGDLRDCVSCHPTGREEEGERGEHGERAEHGEREDREHGGRRHGHEDDDDD